MRYAVWAVLALAAAGCSRSPEPLPAVEPKPANVDEIDESLTREQVRLLVRQRNARITEESNIFDDEFFLSLRITTVTPDVAVELANFKGYLWLGGLTTLSDEAAKALAQHKGYLYLGGLTTLSDEAAKALAQHKGYLYLDGLTTLSDEAAAALRSNPDIRLPDNFKQ